MKTALVILGLGAVLLILFFREPGATDLRQDAGVLVEREEPSGSRGGIQVLTDAPFASKFGKVELSDQQELELIQLAFQDYLSFVKEGQREAIGDNRDFVKALTGGNVQRIAPIPPEHPRINSKQELTDRHGIPFAIHPLSSTAIEVRAAGPDQLLWTPDDHISLTTSGEDLKNRLLGE